MAAPRLFKTAGIVLKTAPLGEADLLVTLISQDGSKLLAMAWGARKMNSRKMGHLDTLTRVDLDLYRGPSMYSIRQVLTLESFVVLKSRLDATARAFYLAELVDGFAVEGSPNPPLYSLFLETLRSVQDAPEDKEPILKFQLEMLRVNGFMPELYRCVECRRDVEAGRHRFVVSLGGVICTDCASKREGATPLSLPALKTLRHFHRNGDADTSRIRISPDLYEEVHAVLDRAIRYWLDREVRSRRFVVQVQRQQAWTAAERRPDHPPHSGEKPALVPRHGGRNPVPPPSRATSLHSRTSTCHSEEAPRRRI